PGQGQGLTGEIGKAAGRADQLVRFFAEAGSHRDVLLLVPPLRHRDKAGRRKYHPGIADVEVHPALDNPWLFKIVGAAEGEYVVTMHDLGDEVRRTKAVDPLLALQPLPVQK